HADPRREAVRPPRETARLLEATALTLTLTAPESYGIEPGQPLILHGVKIGQVIERNLSSKGVSVIVAIAPQPRDVVPGEREVVVARR
ncbi:MCE family protein, partial [Salmonella enterica subsp. enterica serovar Poona]